MEGLRISHDYVLTRHDDVEEFQNPNRIEFPFYWSPDKVFEASLNNDFLINRDFGLSEREDFESIKLSEPILNEPHAGLFKQYEHLITNEGNFEEIKNFSAKSQTTNDKDIHTSNLADLTEESSLIFGKGNKYWKRKDVVHKGILRMIKGFFLDLLLKTFPEYQKKRLWRVNKSKLLNNIKSFPILQGEDSKLSEYIFITIRPTDMKFIKLNKEVKEEALIFFECISKYSHAKLETLFKSDFVKSIFGLIAKNDEYFQTLIDNSSYAKENRYVYYEELKYFKSRFGLGKWLTDNFNW